ncbi:NAD-dependent epimerase/dehydratase family protein [Flavobacterium bomense]|uniref:NAD-dependent epimerase/dehydratase family protein n=1 Tax=Flavobacterium bomense TaxID=2497483 RepID=A0A432CNA9_9FLAO|nr:MULTISPECIES: NAD-dependent epimerase/dehydratase [Flavobacterium]RTY66266.1 NAD-dependent epimerase/dehydratase family protein [Flavobacterium sp. LB2P53]RTZ05506.1 NAD-dependent epimerase/dehydratase family protein [Flavobacterium bomense]
MIKNILLTGGTGFLGSHILKSLLNLNYNVIVLVRNSSDLYRIENLRQKIQLFYLNENHKNLGDLFLNNLIDTIIHTATEYGRGCSLSSILETNLIFPIKLIEEGIKKDLKLFINTDTFFGKPVYKESSYLNEYTISKKYFLDYLSDPKRNLKIVNMRLEHIFGENDSDNKFVTSILIQLIQNKQEVLLTDGLQKRDFIYIDDVVNAYLKVLESNEHLENFTEFEVGRGESIKVRYFVQTLSEIIHSKSELKFGAIGTREGEIQDSVAKLSKLKEIGWEFKYDIKQAIQRMVEFEVEKRSISNKNPD